MCPSLWVWIPGIVYMAYLAWQDWRTREIPGLEAWPLLLVAWPIALICGWPRVVLTGIMFLVSLILWRGGVFGGADTRMIPFVVALAPDAVIWGGVLYLLTWPLRKLRGKEVKNVQDPAFVTYTLGLIFALFLRIASEKGLTLGSIGVLYF